MESHHQISETSPHPSYIQTLKYSEITEKRQERHTWSTVISHLPITISLSTFLYAKTFQEDGLEDVYWDSEEYEDMVQLWDVWYAESAKSAKNHSWKLTWAKQRRV
ncbi:hypothetical protein BDD12DRAFT_882990 [Trichophaea hybrida]|nr:hypothetical protein BDD12DRAFT_882990 [Trichophaea hybrida]